jgi:hypothetical protein
MLYLTNSTIPLEVTHMKAIPKGLTQLRLCSDRTTILCDALPHTALCELPPNLELLHIDSCPFLVDQETGNYSSIIWPSSLSSLTLHLVHASIFQHLPTNLDRLHISILEKTGKLFETPIPTHVLPQSLIKFKLTRDSNSPLIKLIPTTFPPGLTCFAAPLEWGLFESSDWVRLPKSLTRFMLSNNAPGLEHVAEHLPNLKYLSPALSLNAYPKDLLAGLPSQLAALHNKHTNIADIPFLPPTIQRLTLKLRPSADTSQQSLSARLPSSLAPFSCDMARLPTNLVSLELINGSDSFQFSASDFGHLPKKLQHFSFRLSDIENRETLSCLPRSLRKIEIHVGSAREDVPLKHDRQLFDSLPNLQSFEISSRSIQCAWPHWVRQLHRLTELDTLSVDIYDLSQPEDPIVLDFLGMLPNSLTSLGLPMFKTTLLPEHMAKIPPKLAVLNFDSVFGSISNILATDECFKHLPSSLVTLTLPYTMQGLTPAFFKTIPPSVAKIGAPASLNTSQHDFMSTHPDWIGLDP